MQDIISLADQTLEGIPYNLGIAGHSGGHDACSHPVIELFGGKVNFVTVCNPVNIIIVGNYNNILFFYIFLRQITIGIGSNYKIPHYPYPPYVYSFILQELSGFRKEILYFVYNQLI